MVSLTTTLLTSSLLASTVLAHFTLDFPESRGFDEDIEPQFCGGFNTTEARQPFPLGKGPIWIDSHHTQASVYAMLSTSENPTSFSDFNTTSNGTNIPAVTNWFPVSEGEDCWNIDLEALGLGLTNGSLVTLQILFNGGDGPLYQCTDLVLLSNYTLPSNRTCSNDTAASYTATAGASQTSTPSTASASTTAKSSADAHTPITFGILGIAALAVVHLAL
ncbi:uncharacterized protein EHS24_009677 [Apiotrichum porosum]|uniref:Copper acquisition factor BIM1-like domain-containing protein n=1 Tax=Apiotrichum porosum TaxID=105984 RepID=A0A427XMC0_9TREE|nr:uncharacterized protein EHS24_009677 [Apiotrichum porosum]RSH80006.1 hypothetical protein EHS24_009677 [Apiotrichum porosum]